MENGILFYGTYLITEVFAIFCIYDLYSCLMDRKPGTKRNIYCICFAALFIYTFPNWLYQNILLNLVFAILAFTVLSCLFEAGAGYRIALVVFAYFISMLAEIAVFNLEEILGRPNYASEIGYVALSRLVLFIIVKVISLGYQKKKKKYYYGYYWWLALFMPGASMYIIHHTMKLDVAGKGGTGHLSALIITLILLILNVLVFYLYDKLLEKSNEALQIQSIRLQNKSFVNYMEQETQNNLTLRKWKHDNKNNLISLKSLLDHHEYEEAERLIGQEIGRIQIIDAMKYSGNKIVDSIFGYKIQEAHEKNIVVEYNFKIPETLDIHNDDLGIILGNSIDNAVEACEKLEQVKDRIVCVTMSYQKNMLFYSIENPYDNVRKERGRFLTTKSNPAEHGMGLKILEEVSKKYGGDIMVHNENHIFRLEIMLPLSSSLQK